jgi:hypothetical protein
MLADLQRAGEIVASRQAKRLAEISRLEAVNKNSQHRPTDIISIVAPEVVDPRATKGVEPVFGQIKQARGFRQFLLRGFDKAAAEWTVICTVHNLCKLAARA